MYNQRNIQRTIRLSAYRLYIDPKLLTKFFDETRNSAGRILTSSRSQNNLRNKDAF